MQDPDELSPNNTTLVAVSIVCIVLTVVFTVVRFYARFKAQNVFKVRADDCLIIPGALSLVTLGVVCICECCSIAFIKSNKYKYK
jgi:hypothetical protein